MKFHCYFTIDRGDTVAEVPLLEDTLGHKDYIKYNKQLISNMGKKKDQAVASKSPMNKVPAIKFWLQEDLDLTNMDFNDIDNPQPVSSNYVQAFAYILRWISLLRIDHFFLFSLHISITLYESINMIL